MTSEPRLSLREIVAYAWMDLCMAKGARASLPVTNETFDRAIASAGALLGIEREKVVRLLDECADINALAWYAEGRRADLIVD